MNGIIVIDKPKGKTSHDVVMEIKKILGVEKVGHTGTLDPLATGVLPLCINEATKLAQFFNMDKKEYRATMLLGVKTDTLDVEGKTVAEKEPCVGSEEIEKALNSFVGERRQTPPSYSAVKYQGRPLYKWARQGVVVDVMPRDIEIYRLSLEDVALPYVTFTVYCSKGTYIRSLCAEIGDMLGCGACLAELRRTRSGNYSEDAALDLTETAEGEKKEALAAHLINMADVLLDIPAVHVDRPLAEKMRQGYQPVVESLIPHHIPFLAAGDMLRFIQDCRLVAIAKILRPSDQLPVMDGNEQAVRIIRVFNGA
jgi:tRNA pseudouridine55 synthase